VNVSVKSAVNVRLAKNLMRSPVAAPTYDVDDFYIAALHKYDKYVNL
jgi:hypothetical protein